MPFKSYKELKAMKEKDPNKARMLVAKAKRMGKPVVSKSNPGYNGKNDMAYETRMKAVKKRIKQRKNNGMVYSDEDQ